MQLHHYQYIEDTESNRDRYREVARHENLTANTKSAESHLWACAAQTTGDNATAVERYHEFLTAWKDADPDRPEVATAKEFLAKQATCEK